MRSVLYDGSSRIFQYVIGLGVPSYIEHPLATWKVDKDQVFVNKCITLKELKKIYKARPLAVGSVDTISPDVSKSDARKIIPPKLTTVQKTHLANLVADPSVAIICFPVLLSGCVKKCTVKLDSSKHLIVVLLNKLTHTVEVFDDMLPSTMKLKGMSTLLEHGLTQLLVPKLQTLFHVPSINLSLSIPSFKERHYKTLIDTLAAAGYAADNFTAHAAFTANYIVARVADPVASPTILHDRVIKLLQTEVGRRTFCTCYDTLRQFKLHPTPCDTTKLLNPHTLKCVTADGALGRRLQRVSHTNNRKTNINIHEYFIPADARKNGSRLSAQWMEVGVNMSLMRAYLRSKYSDIAYIAKYIFTWNGVKLGTRAFDTTWEKAMASSDTRYVVFSMELSHHTVMETHGNALIYDKEKRELERFEPHGHGYEEFQQTKLDAAIVAFFGARIGSYSPPLLTCPIGLQDDDDDEINPGAKDIGGNCAVWTMYYMEVRLSNPFLPRPAVIKAALTGIKRRGSFRMFINAYHWHVQRAFRQLRRDKRKP